LQLVMANSIACSLKAASYWLCVVFRILTARLREDRKQSEVNSVKVDIYKELTVYLYEFKFTVIIRAPCLLAYRLLGSILLMSSRT
jgi:hypothetical protein